MIEQPERERSKRWIFVDRQNGRVPGWFRATGELSRQLVERLARSLEPGIAQLEIVAWESADARLVAQALLLKPFTPLMCERLGLIRFLREDPHVYAEQLQRTFDARVNAQPKLLRTAGGGR